MSAANATKPSENQLSELFSAASERKQGGLSYAGELTASEVYQLLSNMGGILVDVRTIPEWQFVGTPDVSNTKGQFAAISWKIYPQMTVNPDFAEQLASAGAHFETPLFFLCRTGGRSLDAAVAMTQAGYKLCYNITHGFEGDSDAQGQRGRVNGWKASNLSWKQG